MKEVEINTNVTNVPITTYEQLTALAQDKSCAFNIESPDRKNYTSFLNFLSNVKYNLEEMAEGNNITLKPEVQEEKKAAEELANQLGAYYTSLKALNELGYTFNDKQAIDAHLDKIKGFESFLKQGKGKTNYQRIIEASNQATPEKTFAIGYNILENNLHYGFKIDNVTKAVAKQEIKIDEPEISALDRIESVRVPVESNKSAYKNGSKDPRDIIVKIMAARYVAESERNDSTKLSKTMTDTKLNEAVKMLNDNQLFTDWLDKVLEDSKLRDKAVDAVCTGHGGKLDDMFKMHLANSKTAQLDIPAELDRYRPSALMRIEVLQKRADNIVKKGYSPSKELAEIIVLRNAIRAERNAKSSLKTQIPKDYAKYKDDIEHLAGDENFNNIIKRNSVRDYITTGHGGKMIENIRLQYKLTDNNLKTLSVTDIIDEGTIGGRLSMLKRKADELNKTVSAIADAEREGTDNHTTKQKSDLSDEAIDLVAEYLALSIHRASIKDANVDEMNIPWEKVNEIKRSCMQSHDFKFAMGMGGFLEKTTEKLTELTEINSTPSSFTISFREKLQGHISDSALNKVANIAKQSGKQKTNNVKPTVPNI
jgi:hypothetical protein